MAHKCTQTLEIILKVTVQVNKLKYSTHGKKRLKFCYFFKLADYSLDSMIGCLLYKLVNMSTVTS